MSEKQNGKVNMGELANKVKSAIQHYQDYIKLIEIGQHPISYCGQTKFGPDLKGYMETLIIIPLKIVYLGECFNLY